MDFFVACLALFLNVLFNSFAQPVFGLLIALLLFSVLVSLFCFMVRSVRGGR